MAFDPTADTGPGQGEEATTQERRAAERRACRKKTSCHPMGHVAAGTAAQVVDVSTSGIGLVLGRRFEPGTVLVVGIDDAGGGPARTALARVVRLAARPAGKWLLGCAFTSELGEEDVRAIEREAVGPAEAERRVWVRVSSNIKTFGSSGSTQWSGRWPVKVVDVGEKSLALLLRFPLEIGAHIKVEWPTEDGPARELLVRVARRQAQARGEWLLGCELIRPASLA